MFWKCDGFHAVDWLLRGTRDQSGVSLRTEPVYDPTHPLADERGYIYESNVDVATEQLDATEAENMFSANMAVFEVVKSMASKALTLGKG